MSLSLIATGAAVSLGAPAPLAAPVVSGVASFLGSIDSKWFGGGQRDADRKGRVAWLYDAASRGSVLAAQIIYAGPDNVASDEDPYWQSAQQGLQSGSAIAQATWEAAVNAGKFWPVGQPFDMPTQRATIIQQLALRGQPAPGIAMPKASTSTGPIQTAVGNGIQTVGSQIVNAAANGANPSGNYVTLPTSFNTLFLWGAVGVIALLVLRKE